MKTYSALLFSLVLSLQLFGVLLLAPQRTEAALTRTAQGSGESASNSVTTGSFTPSDNSLLVAVVGGVADGSSATPTDDSSVSDGSLTWTKRVSAQEEADGAGAVNWTVWVEIWTAPVATGASMTVTGSNTNSMDGMGAVPMMVGIV